MMLNRTHFLCAAALIALVAGANGAQANSRYNSGYHSGYSAGYQAGYANGYNFGYDAGQDRAQRDDHYRSDPYRRHNPYQSSDRGRDGTYSSSSDRVVYARGAYDYGSDCHNDNAATGTIIGAAAGGVIGNQFGHGDGKTAATVGGVILGGLAGNAIARDVSCDDRPYAFRTYSQGFDGQIGNRYDWRNDQDQDHGYFTPTREYNRDRFVCRDFTEVTYRNGQEFSRNGTACRQEDGNWHFE
jgi:surface antigen